MNFQTLISRLIREVTRRIRNGQLTERGFARLTRMSQPHIHHILNGKRGLSPEIADRFLEALGLDIEHLLQLQEEAGTAPPFPMHVEQTILLPLMDGALGPFESLPALQQSTAYLPFPASLLPRPEHCAAIRLGFDPLLAPIFQPGDLLVFEHTLPQSETAPTGVAIVESVDHWLLSVHPESFPFLPLPAELAMRTHPDSRSIGHVLWLIRNVKPPEWA